MFTRHQFSFDQIGLQVSLGNLRQVVLTCWRPGHPIDTQMFGDESPLVANYRSTHIDLHIAVARGIHAQKKTQLRGTIALAGTPICCLNIQHCCSARKTRYQERELGSSSKQHSLQVRIGITILSAAKTPARRYRKYACFQAHFRYELGDCLWSPMRDFISWPASPCVRVNLLGDFARPESCNLFNQIDRDGFG